MASFCGKIAVIVVCNALMVSVSNAQKLTRIQRDLAETMLDNVSSDVSKYYFDPKFHGLAWSDLVQKTKESVDQAPDMAVANAEIAALLEHLDDSHTSFSPPRNLTTVDYGFEFKIFGKHAFITKVKAKSDAESKGMKAGDELLTIEGFAVDREGASKLEYAMVVLMPRSSLKLDLRDPTGKVTQITVNGSVKTRSSVAGLGDSTWNINEGIMHRENAWEKERAKYREFGNELMILKVPAFVETSGDVDALFRRARSHKALIVDVRGCPGGLVDSVLDYLGDIFPHDVNVGNWVHRNKVDHLMAKANRRDAFNGDLIVLVDSETASGGEIFAKMVQLQERGTILGDHSSGKTMESVGHGHHYGDNPIYYYGDSITVADTVMPDGKSLEHVGVEPDRTMLPAPADIAAKRDPVLAYAAGLEGVKISPEDAAKLFPENDSDK